MTQTVAGSFATGNNVAGLLDQQSGVLVVGSQLSGNMLLTIGGDVSAGNSVKTQKSTNNGTTWADQSTYTTAQAKVAVTVAAGDQWRLVTVVMAALKTINYAMSLEN